MPPRDPSPSVCSWFGGRRAAVLALAASLVITGTSGAQTQEPPPAPPPLKRPSYGLLRQNENWSVLAGQDSASADHDFFDPIKYVALSDDGSIWASFGGEVRFRYEDWNNFNFGAPPGVSHDDGFLLTRMRANADVHFGERVRAFLELKSAQATDRDLPGGRRTLDMDTFALQQGFVDVVFPVGDGSLMVRPGRQMLAYGAQRLVSPLPWGNTLRTWDGATAVWSQDAWSVTALATAFAPVDKTEFNDTDDDQLLYGLYARNSAKGSKAGTEYYWLGTTREDVTFNGSTGDQDRQTLGLRYWRPLGASMDAEVEGAYQLGEVGDDDVSAWMVASQLGFTPGGEGTPRYWIGFDYASGDGEPGGDVGTFDQLYPLGHAYYGYIDAVGRQNAIDASFGASWKAMKDVTLGLGNHAFWLASKDDALYNAGGGVSRAPGSFDSSYLGFEVDATVGWKPERHVATLLGYSHFFAGDALEDSGPSDDVDFVYLQVTYTF